MPIRPSVKSIEGNLLYIDEGGNLVLDTIGKINGQIQSSVVPQFLVRGGPTPGVSLTLTDGTHTVAAVGRITVSGATVGGTTPNSTLTVAGGGGPQVNAAVTPHAGGGQAAATQLSAGYTFVNTPATTGDSIALPDAVAGAFLCLILPINETPGLAVEVFLKNGSSDTVLGVVDSIYWGPGPQAGSASSVPLMFWCVVDGDWFTNGNLN